MNTFERGSEWRKWDLHTHTKDTNKNDQFKSKTFEDFCIVFFKKALEKNINAIGITDYFSIDNYEKTKKFINELEPSDIFTEEEINRIKEIFIFPNIELRMMPSTDSGKLINIHLLLNPDENFLESLTNDLFGSLEDSNGNKMNRSGIISLGKESNSILDEDAAYRQGITEFHLELSKLKELLKKKSLKENMIIVVSNSNDDGASALQEHYTLFDNENGQLDAVRRNIYKLSDAIFSGNPRDRNYFLGEKEGCNEQLVVHKCGSLKPCIHGSDAHCEDKLFNPKKSRFCWIKADLNFEGLKQIICEPKDRVQIQPNKPEEKSGYHVIKSIEIDSEICKQKISFNPNLNTIIGGRSTGKSTLLQLIAYRVSPKISGIQQFIKSVPQEGIKITWQDGEENVARDIEFFPQSYMYDIARNDEQKNKLIQSIVEEKDNNGLIKDYEKFCDVNKTTIQSDLDNLFELQKSVDALTGDLKEKGDKEGLEKEIKNLESKIKSSQQDTKFQESELKKYECLKQEILDCERKIQESEKDKFEIFSLQNEELFDPSFIYKFNKLSSPYSKVIRSIFDSIKQKSIKEWKENLTTRLNDIDKSLITLKDEISDKKNSVLFTKGSKYLEQNKQYKEFNDRLNVEREKLTDIISIQEKKQAIIQQKEKLFQKIIKKHIEFSEKIDELTSGFSLVHDDIEIKVKKIYLHEKCERLLKDFVNLKSYKRQSFVNNWGGDYQKDTKKTIEEFLKNSLLNEIELKSYKDVKDLAKGLLTDNWFSISYELTYQNDTFNKMSDGKKSFVILKLLLEFSNKECPILIDQPEDSLDNRAIYNELVAYLKEKKKNRQIILVTHNANIVVNSDAEEVIVANQHGEDSKNQDCIKFQYTTGSLENTKPKDENASIVLQSQGIREHVCEVLEGGTEAFKKRENKYAIA